MRACQADSRCMMPWPSGAQVKSRRTARRPGRNSIRLRGLFDVEARLQCLDRAKRRTLRRAHHPFLCLSKGFTPLVALLSA